MLRILILCGLVGVVVSQYSPSSYDAPLPPRPVIPGAVPVGGPVRSRGRAPARARPLLLEETEARPARPRAPRLRPQALPPRPPPTLPPPKPVVEPIDESPIYRDEDDLPNYPSTPSIPIPRPPPQPTFVPSEEYNPPPRPQFRNTIQEEDLDIPTRQLPLEPVTRSRPQYKPTPSPQPQLRPNPTPQYRPAPQPTRGSPQPPAPVRQPQPTRTSKKEQAKVSESTRPRKPTVQVIRKYREDNPDGSITWGFENDDGTYKEETIGVDCVTRGKYGYFDPDGVRREFTYSSGIPCDPNRGREEDAEGQGSEGYVDYTNNRYVMANGDSVDLDRMVKNRARKPVQQYYRN